MPCTTHTAALVPYGLPRLGFEVAQVGQGL